MSQLSFNIKRWYSTILRKVRYPHRSHPIPPVIERSISILLLFSFFLSSSIVTKEFYLYFIFPKHGRAKTNKGLRRLRLPSIKTERPAAAAHTRSKSRSGITFLESSRLQRKPTSIGKQTRNIIHRIILQIFARIIFKSKAYIDHTINSTFS